LKIYLDRTVMHVCQIGNRLTVFFSASLSPKTPRYFQWRYSTRHCTCWTVACGAWIITDADDGTWYRDDGDERHDSGVISALSAAEATWPASLIYNSPASPASTSRMRRRKRD